MCAKPASLPSLRWARVFNVLKILFKIAPNKQLSWPVGIKSCPRTSHRSVPAASPAHHSACKQPDLQSRSRRPKERGTCTTCNKHTPEAASHAPGHLIKINRQIREGNLRGSSPPVWLTSASHLAALPTEARTLGEATKLHTRPVLVCRSPSWSTLG